MQTFSITDLDGFAISIRDGAARSISENYTENLDHFVSIEQVKKMISTNQIGLDEDGLPVITEDIFDSIFTEIRSMIYQIALSKLAANGLIECAWDNDSNEMIFWINSANEGLKFINSLPSE